MYPSPGTNQLAVIARTPFVFPLTPSTGICVVRVRRSHPIRHIRMVAVRIGWSPGICMTHELSLLSTFYYIRQVKLFLITTTTRITKAIPDKAGTVSSNPG